MDAAISAAYTQLLSVGILWVSLHCSGMCGPLVLGLGFGRATSTAAPHLQLMAYQLGKGTIYALLGALAGWLGSAVSRTLEHVGPPLTGLLGMALLVGTVASNLHGTRPGAPTWASLFASPLAGLQRRRRSPLERAFLLGMLMAALPCMLVVWVLALGASTQSPLHGALLMLLLVAMNSVPLLVAVHLPQGLAHRLPRLSALGPWMGALSGTWLLLVSAAAAGLIHHASLHFGLGGRGYVVMFW